MARTPKCEMISALVASTMLGGFASYADDLEVLWRGTLKPWFFCKIVSQNGGRLCTKQGCKNTWL